MALRKEFTRASVMQRIRYVRVLRTQTYEIYRNLADAATVVATPINICVVALVLFWASDERP